MGLRDDALAVKERLAIETGERLEKENKQGREHAEGILRHLIRNTLGGKYNPKIEWRNIWNINLCFAIIDDLVFIVRGRGHLEYLALYKHCNKCSSDLLSNAIYRLEDIVPWINDDQWYHNCE